MLKTPHKRTNDKTLIIPLIAKFMNSGKIYESKLDTNEVNAEQGIIIKIIISKGLIILSLFLVYFFITIKFKTHVIT